MMFGHKNSSSNRLKTKNLKPIGKRASSRTGSKGSARQSSSRKSAKSKKKKVSEISKKNPEFNPLLSVKTIFGRQNSTIHSLSSSLCVDALKQGCVDTFQEIFHLSHREPVLIDPVAEKFFSIGSNRMIQLQSDMCKAEVFLRKKKFREAYEIYHDVSAYLEGEKDTEQSTYFMQKGKEVCMRSGDPDLCRLACKELGRLFHRLDRLDLSIEEHEQQHYIVEKDHDLFKPEDVQSCKEDLILAYLAKYNSIKKFGKGGSSKEPKSARRKKKSPEGGPADEEGQASQPSSARDGQEDFDENVRICLTFLKKAYDLANTSEDKTLLSKICFRIGKVYQRLKDYDKAMKYLLEYREICDELGDVKGSGLGDKHIAKILQNTSKDTTLSPEKQKENYENALNSYKSFLEKSRESGVKRNIGKSCERIGYLLVMNKKPTESLEYFQENYDLAKEAGDMDWLNSARIRLGYARGVCGIKDFLSMIEKNEIQLLLDWKDRREMQNFGQKSIGKRNEEEIEVDGEEGEEDYIEEEIPKKKKEEEEED